MIADMHARGPPAESRKKQSKNKKKKKSRSQQVKLISLSGAKEVAVEEQLLFVTAQRFQGLPTSFLVQIFSCLFTTVKPFVFTSVWYKLDRMGADQLLGN